MFREKLNKKEIKNTDLLIISVIFITLVLFLIPKSGEVITKFLVKSYNQTKNYIHSYKDNDEIERFGVVEFKAEKKNFSVRYDFWGNDYSCVESNLEANLTLDLYRKETIETTFGKENSVNLDYYLKGNYRYYSGGYNTISLCNIYIDNRNLFPRPSINTLQTAELTKTKIENEDAERLKIATNKSENIRLILSKYYPDLLKSITEAGYSI